MTQTAYKMTMQEAFDKAAKGVIKQGAPGEGDNGCAYYAVRPMGQVFHCGIGHLLPDDAICQKWDHYGNIEYMEDTLFDYLAKEASLSHLSRDFLEAIQNAHDNATLQSGEFINNFKKGMLKVASDFRLKPCALLTDGEV